MMRIRASTTQRGYGYRFQQDRQDYLAAFIPRQPCVRCAYPMHDWPHVKNKDGRYTCAYCDLDHTDGSGKQAYNGLAHRSCNRRAGQRQTSRILKARRHGYVIPPQQPWQPSRQW